MVNDNEISYASTQVRHKESDLAAKRNAEVPNQQEIEVLEKELKVLRQKLHDLESRKRSELDRAKRDVAQKKLDDRRLKPF